LLAHRLLRGPDRADAAIVRALAVAHGDLLVTPPDGPPAESGPVAILCYVYASTPQGKVTRLERKSAAHGELEGPGARLSVRRHSACPVTPIPVAHPPPA
jgi:hypothetical protein